MVVIKNINYHLCKKANYLWFSLARTNQIAQHKYSLE